MLDLEFSVLLGVVGVAKSLSMVTAVAVREFAGRVTAFWGKNGNWGIWDIAILTVLLVVSMAVALRPNDVVADRNLANLAFNGLRPLLQYCNGIVREVLILQLD